jgi:hypothetical protein
MPEPEEFAMPPIPPEIKDAALRILLDHAHRGATLTYTELNTQLPEPFPAKGHYFANMIGQLCDAVNKRHERETGLDFMISALVHTATSPHLPGDGFFALADDLGKLPYTEDIPTRRAFVGRQLDAVFTHYGNDG